MPRNLVETPELTVSFVSEAHIPTSRGEKQVSLRVASCLARRDDFGLFFGLVVRTMQIGSDSLTLFVKIFRIELLYNSSCRSRAAISPS